MPRDSDGAANAFMPLYGGDYLRDTMHLTCAEHGVYLKLLIHYWHTQRALPDDQRKLEGIAGVRTDDERAALAEVTSQFFVKRGGTLRNVRMDREIERAVAIKRRLSEGAKESARRRWGDPDGRSRAQRVSEARAAGSHTEAEWSAMLQVFGNRCVRCGTSADLLNGQKLNKDHVRPLRSGGSDRIENLQPLCRNCNSSKGRIEEDFREAFDPNWKVRLAELCAAPELGMPNACSPPPPPEPEPKPKEKKGQKRSAAPDGATVAAWTAYATAYRARYGVDPVRNAKVNGQVARFVERVGAEEAPAIAEFYVRSERGLYVSARHVVDLLLRDAEGVRTEWAAGLAAVDQRGRVGGPSAVESRNAERARAFAEGRKS